MVMPFFFLGASSGFGVCFLWDELALVDWETAAGDDVPLYEGVTGLLFGYGDVFFFAGWGWV